MLQTIESYDFLKLILGSITEHIAVIDHDGWIRYINQAWIKFGQENGYSTKSDWLRDLIAI